MNLDDQYNPMLKRVLT